MDEPATRVGAPGRVPRRARDRRQDRHERGHHHSGLLALFRPGQPPDRKPGDVVERGAPLFAIDASEFVQGQNDLVTAVAGVEKAKSRLALAQTSEKRQRELLAIRGGALKDLEQAQSDLVRARRPALGGNRARRVAQPAPRPRPLRRGDRRVEKLTVGAEPVAAPMGGTVVQRQVGLGQYISVGATDPIYTSAISRPCGWSPTSANPDAPKIKVGQPSRSPCSPSPAAPSTPGSTIGAGARSQHPPPDGARGDPQPDHELQARDVRVLPHLSGDSRMMPSVPQEAIVYGGAEARVWVAPRQNPSSTRPIEAGATPDGLVEVQEGAQRRRDRCRQRHALHRPRRHPRLTRPRAGPFPHACHRRRRPQAAHPRDHPGAVHDGRRAGRLSHAEHRGLSRPGAAAGRHHHPESRPVVGGDRALHHHPDRGARWRGCPTSRRCAPSRCSASPT